MAGFSMPAVAAGASFAAVSAEGLLLLFALGQSPQ